MLKEEILNALRQLRGSKDLVVIQIPMSSFQKVN